MNGLRAMYVEPRDWIPSSLLRWDVLTLYVWIVFGGAFFASLGAMIVLHVTDFRLAPDDPEVVEVADAREVISARFVQKGRVLDPNELPNRRVPQLSTAVPDDLVVSKAPRERRPRPDAGPPPPNATADLLQRLGDRAQVFAEIAEQRELEGDPDGIEEGTETIARAGDLYAGRLYSLFRRGWTVPTTIDDEEKRGLRTSVTIDIGQDMRVTGFRVVGPSGNPLFDQSVADRIQQVQESNTNLPDPPEEIAADYVGRTITLRFLGRHAG